MVLPSAVQSVPKKLHSKRGEAGTEVVGEDDIGEEEPRLLRFSSRLLRRGDAGEPLFLRKENMVLRDVHRTIMILVSGLQPSKGGQQRLSNTQSGVMAASLEIQGSPKH